MQKKSDQNQQKLRREAVKLAREKNDPDLENLNAEELRTLIHEYQVQRIELELQNEELRVIQEEIQAARNRFAALYNNAPMGYLTLDRNGVIIQCNDTFARMLNNKPENIAGRPMADFLDAEQARLFLGRFGSFSRDPEGKQLELSIGLQGRRRSLRCSGRIDEEMSLQRGEKCLLVMVDDITERSLMRQKLKESEERYRLLCDVTMEGIVIHKNGIIRDLNEAMARMLGFERDELLGVNILETLIHEEDQARVRENIVKEYAEPYVIRAMRKNGQVFYAELEARNFQAKGEFLRVAAVRDVTRRKLAEEALVESEQRFKTLYMDSPVSILVHDQDDGRVIDANPAAFRTMGYADIRQLNEGFFLKDYPYSFEDAQVWIQRAVNEGPQIVEWANRKADGSILWEQVHLRKTVINGTSRVMAILIDITDRKLAEDKIKKINQELEKANAEKDSLFTILGHDLKSPLSGVLSLTELLVEEDDISTGEVTQALKIMRSSMKNVLVLLDDLLQWSRTIKGDAEFSPECMRLRPLLEECAGMASETARQKKISISLEVQDQLKALVDGSMIRTVLRNLLFNAIKFSPRNSEVMITARMHNKMVQVKVQDWGIGMDQATMGSLFSMGGDKLQTGTEGEKGTGVGMLLSKGLIDTHGGGIQVESEQGKGTTVLFTLPPC